MNMDTKRRRFWDVTEKVSEEYQKLPSVAGVMVGGSLARNFTDKYSDIEMYVYYNKIMPSKWDISRIVDNLKANLTRSKNKHWYHPAWGYHTFFKVNDIIVELGYRDIESIEERMKAYLNGKAIVSKPGIHDTPFGHYESGVASCIHESKIIFDKVGEMKRLKETVSAYPAILKKKTIDYYLKDAEILIKKKLEPATLRDDTYHFNAVLANVIRSMNLVIFSLNETHFPGDKWNQVYIDRFNIKPEGYDALMNALFSTSDIPLANKIKKLGYVKRILKNLRNVCNP